MDGRALELDDRACGVLVRVELDEREAAVGLHTDLDDVAEAGKERDEVRLSRVGDEVPDVDGRVVRGRLRNDDFKLGSAQMSVLLLRSRGNE